MLTPKMRDELIEETLSYLGVLKYNYGYVPNKVIALCVGGFYNITSLHELNDFKLIKLASYIEALYDQKTNEQWFK